jgi:hypothetical protein
MPNQLNAQVGDALVARNAPRFDGYQVVANTWKPVDQLTAKMTKGTNSKVFNINFYGPGTQAGCELVQFIQEPPVEDLKKSMVIAEADDSPNVPGQLWTVIKADPIGFDEPPLHFQCELYSSPVLDASKTTPAES